MYLYCYVYVFLLYVYVFLLLCMCCIVSFCYFVDRLCVNVYLKLPAGLNPIAVNKYVKTCMALKCTKYSLNTFAAARYNHLKCREAK